MNTSTMKKLPLINSVCRAIITSERTSVHTRALMEISKSKPEYKFERDLFRKISPKTTNQIQKGISLLCLTITKLSFPKQKKHLTR